MTTNLKLAVLSGRRMDQGKTSFVDNVIATRLDNLIRIEIESASTGSAKEGITRIPATQLPELRDALLDLDDDQNLVVDVGGSEYGDFMREITQYRSTTAEFDRFVFVMRAGGIKQLDALESIMELISMGAEPAKVSVLFNFAPYTVGLPNLRATLRAQFGGVFDAADKAGFHVCETPIMAADAMYKTVFGSKKWNIDALASGQDFRLQMKELRKAGQPVPDALRALESAQENARSFGKPNLDAVWDEIMTATRETA